MKKGFLSFINLVFLLSASSLAAQDSVEVRLKVVPSDYQLFYQGSRVPFYTNSDGLRVYELPRSSIRVTLSAYGWFVKTIALDLTQDVRFFETKLEPRDGPLRFVESVKTVKRPRSVAFYPDGSKLVVPSSVQDKADILDARTLAKTGELAFPAEDRGGSVDVAAEEGEVWLTSNFGSISIFDAKSLAFLQSVPAPTQSFLSHFGGSTLTLFSWDTGEIFSIDAHSKVSQKLTAVTGSPRGIGASEGRFFVSRFDAGSIQIFDRTSGALIDTWKTGGAPRAVVAASGKVFWSDMSQGKVFWATANEGTPLGSLAVGSNPHVFAYHAAKNWIAVAVRGKNNPDDYTLPGPEYGQIALIDATSGQLLGSVWAQNQPTGLAFSPDGNWLAFTDFLDDTVELYRILR